jgi:hypothetical protein
MENRQFLPLRAMCMKGYRLGISKREILVLPRNISESYPGSMVYYALWI